MEQQPKRQRRDDEEGTDHAHGPQEALIEEEATRYAEDMKLEFLNRCIDAHEWSGVMEATTQGKRRSYSCAVKDLESAYRELLHRAIAADLQARGSAPPPARGSAPPPAHDGDPLSKSKYQVRMLHQLIMTKLENGAGADESFKKWAHMLIKNMLEHNFVRCQWQYVAKIAQDIAAQASTAYDESAGEARANMNELLGLMPQMQ